MLKRRDAIKLAGGAAIASALPAPPFLRRAFAQSGQTWPNRFVRLVVPFPPGGGTDAIARVVAAKLSDIWGQQLVVENRGGGATNIGTEGVVRSEPDGYTLLLQSMPLAVNRFLFRSLSYDPVADLAPVSLLCEYPNIMAVPISSPATSVTEFIAFANANRGKVTFASSGHGTSVHLSGELFRRMARRRDAARAVSRRGPGAQRPHSRARRRHVQQYRRGAAADPGRQAARAGGDHGQARYRGAAVADRSRNRASRASTCRPGTRSSRPHRRRPRSSGRCTPTPPRRLPTRSIKSRLEGLGVTVVGSTPAELAAFLKSEMEKWAPVIREAGIRADD